MYSVMDGIGGHAPLSANPQSGILSVDVGHGGSSIIALHEEFVFQHRNVSPFYTSNLHFPARLSSTVSIRFRRSDVPISCLHPMYSHNVRLL